MRIYRERITAIARSVVTALVDKELIDVLAEDRPEVELDVESVLKEYRRMDHELSESARDLVEQRGVDYSHTFKIKSKLAAERKFGLGEEGLAWIADQIVEILLQSKFVDEVYGEDHELRAVVNPILRKELAVESELDREVRRRIKNLEEGTSDFEVEYQKTLEQLRSHGKG